MTTLQTRPAPGLQTGREPAQGDGRESRPRIRPARRADAGALETIIESATRVLCARDYTPEQVEAFLHHGFIAMDTRLIDDGTLYVAEVDGQVVGCGGWSFRAATYGSGGDGGEGQAARLDPARDAARIRLCFVHPEWARRGIGRRLLEASENAARAAGFRRLQLSATHTGTKLYEACGYRAGQTLEETLPDGVTVSGVHMEKDLDENGNA